VRYTAREPPEWPLRGASAFILVAMKLSVVLPAHNEAACLPSLLARLVAALDALEHDWEVVVVDDGSTDTTWALIKEAAEGDDRVRGLRLSRNFGHQVALTAGLQVAEGDAVITMDSDLQHPPELIGALTAKASEGHDVVYAVRGPKDSEAWFKVTSAAFFYWLLNRLSSLDLPHGGADFRYMSRRAVNALLAMPERHRFLRGMSRWVGFSQAYIEYERPPRHAGQSKYTQRRMIRFAFDAVVSFSALPLRIASFFGMLFSFLGGLYLIFVVASHLFAESIVPGWTSVVGVVLVLGGVQLACLGIIGQYVGRMYDEMKGRPLFFLWEDTSGALETGFQRRASDRTPGELVRSTHQG
jgi:dolichol-phosphate mannosyltransferase